jgi:hypothetical protein
MGRDFALMEGAGHGRAGTDKSVGTVAETTKNAEKKDDLCAYLAERPGSKADKQLIHNIKHALWH